MKNWSRFETEKLINLVEQHPCIYNVRCCDYLDRNKKAQVMNDISLQMKEVDSELNVAEIKRKWKNLRTQYMQEMRAIKQSKKSGSGVADIYRPKLWCFQQLSFLESHIDSRASVDNINTNPYFTILDDIPSSDPSVSNELDEVHATDVVRTADENDICLSNSSQNTSFDNKRPERKKKKSHAIDEFRKDISGFKTVLAARKSDKKYAWLGALVVETMDEISPEDRDDAVWEVQCLMRKLKQEAKRKLACSTSSTKDVLELSIEGIFDEDEEYLV